jgi:hypothetical protein
LSQQSSPHPLFKTTEPLSPIDISYDVNFIGCKWVFKKKCNLDGSSRFKSHFVIQGFEQVEGIDSGNLCSSVETVYFTAITHYCCQETMEIRSYRYGFGVHNPEIDKDVYMALPEGIYWNHPRININQCKAEA